MNVSPSKFPDDSILLDYFSQRMKDGDGSSRNSLPASPHSHEEACKEIMVKKNILSPSGEYIRTTYEIPPGYMVQEDRENWLKPLTQERTRFQWGENIYEIPLLVVLRRFYQGPWKHPIPLSERHALFVIKGPSVFSYLSEKVLRRLYVTFVHSEVWPVEQPKAPIAIQSFVSLPHLEESPFSSLIGEIIQKFPELAPIIDQFAHKFFFQKAKKSGCEIEVGNARITFSADREILFTCQALELNFLTKTIFCSSLTCLGQVFTDWAAKNLRVLSGKKVESPSQLMQALFWITVKGFRCLDPNEIHPLLKEYQRYGKDCSLKLWTKECYRHQVEWRTRTDPFFYGWNLVSLLMERWKDRNASLISIKNFLVPLLRPESFPLAQMMVKGFFGNEVIGETYGDLCFSLSLILLSFGSLTEEFSWDYLQHGIGQRIRFQCRDASKKWSLYFWMPPPFQSKKRFPFSLWPVQRWEHLEIFFSSMVLRPDKPEGSIPALHEDEREWRLQIVADLWECPHAPAHAMGWAILFILMAQPKASEAFQKSFAGLPLLLSSDFLPKWQKLFQRYLCRFFDEKEEWKFFLPGLEELFQGKISYEQWQIEATILDPEKKIYPPDCFTPAQKGEIFQRLSILQQGKALAFLFSAFAPNEWTKRLIFLLSNHDPDILWPLPWIHKAVDHIVSQSKEEIFQFLGENRSKEAFLQMIGYYDQRFNGVDDEFLVAFVERWNALDRQNILFTQEERLESLCYIIAMKQPNHRREVLLEFFCRLLDQGEHSVYRQYFLSYLKSPPQNKNTTAQQDFLDVYQLFCEAFLKNDRIPQETKKDFIAQTKQILKERYPAPVLRSCTKTLDRMICVSKFL